MLKKITLTEDHIKLIPFFFLQEQEDSDVVGVDRNQMFCLGSHLLDDMAMVLGLMDKAIPHTEDNPDGRAFEDDAEQYMLSLYEFMSTNLYYIEQLIHQFVVKGGITAGTYRCIDTDLLWEKID
jgi:hypothetical protein